MDLEIILVIIGIVVAVIIGGWQIILARKQNAQALEKEVQVRDSQSDKSKKVTQTDRSVHEPQTTKPKKIYYPKDITDDLDKLSPYQRATVRESYYGLKVEWIVTFYDIASLQDNNARVMLRDRGMYPWIYCDLEITDYPELKIIKEGEELCVAGEISEIDENTITLSNCTLSFS